MQIGILGETDWLTLSLDSTDLVVPTVDEHERQYQLHRIGEVLDHDNWLAIQMQAALHDAFIEVCLRYCGSFESFQTARRKGFNFMLAVFRGSNGIYLARVIGITNARIDHSTLMAGLVETLPLFRKDGSIYSGDSLITTLLRNVPAHIAR
jgi:hypothetical protein